MHSKPLPLYCLPNREMLEVDGVVVHYFSAKNVDKANEFDLYVCRKLMLDLNREKAKREWFMKEAKWPDDRMYASAHLLIGREGEVWKLAPFDKQCYHAGASVMNGRKACNRWTIGIEMVGHQHSGFSKAQYLALTEVLVQLESMYGFSRNNVMGHDSVRHAAIACAPGKTYKRKYDPSGRSDGTGDNFDWFYLGKLWNDCVPNPEGVAGLTQLDEIIEADPNSHN